MKSFQSAAVALAALLISGPAAAATKTAVFAGGCFWSVEKAMDHLPGVTDVVVGYAGGTRPNPTYDSHDGYLEAVHVTYDPAKITYAKLVDGFFHNIDPTDDRGQICDKGPSYRTAVFVAGPEERAAATAVKAQVAKTLGKTVATEIRPAARFWRGEGYHQDYAKRNPIAYERYRIGCGRDRVLKAVWGDRR